MTNLEKLVRRGETVEHYCEGTYKDFVKLVDWAMKDTEND